MNYYEIMFILNPDLGEVESEKTLSRYKAVIEKNKGSIIRIDDMGLKTMAYKISRKSKGRYFLCYLEGPSEMTFEVERFLKIDENILRFVIIRLEEGTKREDLERKVEAKPIEVVSSEEIEAKKSTFEAPEAEQELKVEEAAAEGEVSGGENGAE